MYGATTGTGLDPYINLTVTRGTIASPSFDACTGFSADATDYIGSGAGVVYNGTLAGFPDAWTGGIVDAPSATETWTTNEVHTYRFAWTVADNDLAQGKNATQTFTWEARNN